MPVVGSAVSVEPCGDRPGFMLTRAAGDVYLRASSQDDRDAWIHALEISIAAAGNKKSWAFEGGDAEAICVQDRIMRKQSRKTQMQANVVTTRKIAE